MNDDNFKFLACFKRSHLIMVSTPGQETTLYGRRVKSIEPQHFANGAISLSASYGVTYVDEDDMAGK